MPHEPIQVHIGSEDTKAVTRSTKRAGSIAILMGNHSVLFEYLKQPVKLFMNITNAIPGKRQTGRRRFLRLGNRHNYFRDMLDSKYG